MTEKLHANDNVPPQEGLDRKLVRVALNDLTHDLRHLPFLLASSGVLAYKQLGPLTEDLEQREIYWRSGTPPGRKQVTETSIACAQIITELNELDERPIMRPKGTSPRRNPKERDGTNRGNTPTLPPTHQVLQKARSLKTRIHAYTEVHYYREQRDHIEKASDHIDKDAKTFDTVLKADPLLVKHAYIERMSDIRERLYTEWFAFKNIVVRPDQILGWTEDPYHARSTTLKITLADASTLLDLMHGELFQEQDGVPHEVGALQKGLQELFTLTEELVRYMTDRTSEIDAWVQDLDERSQRTRDLSTDP